MDLYPTDYLKFGNFSVKIQMKWTDDAFEETTTNL